MANQEQLLKRVFDLQKPTSWPRKVQDFLKANESFYKELYRKKEVGELSYWQSVAVAAQADRLHLELRAILQPHHMTGYHCTRLTESEINEVRTKGLQPSSPELLNERIRRLPIPARIQKRLCNENYAADGNRKGMIWFCLFPPVQQAFGVQWFFQSWGGEALFRLHEEDLETGPLLQQIGIPCVVEMKVPIRSMRHQFFVGDILKHHFGYESGPIVQEDWTSSPVAAADIVKLHLHPKTSFIRLTGWDNGCE